MLEPLVSVVIPAWNVEAYIGEAIDSVLAQDHRPIEVIVVDDGSRDGTRAVIESYDAPVRYVSQEHAGIGAARNRGIALARGGYMAFLDGDDLWEAGKLQLQLQAMAAPEQPELVFGHSRQFLSPDLGTDARQRIRFTTELQPALVPSAMLARREAFERVGGYDETLRVGEALDWLARARAHGLREAMLAEHVFSRRLHTANYMRRNSGLVHDYPGMLKAALDLRRARGLA